MTSVAGGLDFNARQIRTAMAEAVASGADVLLTPEMGHLRFPGRGPCWGEASSLMTSRRPSAL